MLASLIDQLMTEFGTSFSCWTDDLTVVLRLWNRLRWYLWSRASFKLVLFGFSLPFFLKIFNLLRTTSNTAKEEYLTQAANCEQRWDVKPTAAATCCTSEDGNSMKWSKNTSLCNSGENTPDRTICFHSHRSKWWRQKVLQQRCWCRENTHVLIHLNLTAAAAATAAAAECYCHLILTHHLRQTASAAQHRQSLLFSETVSHVGVFLTL